jgi:hypothetical protein
MKGEGRHPNARWSLWGFVVKRESRMGGQMYWRAIYRHYLCDRIEKARDGDGNFTPIHIYQGA